MTPNCYHFKTLQMLLNNTVRSPSTATFKVVRTTPHKPTDHCKRQFLRKICKNCLLSLKPISSAANGTFITATNFGCPFSESPKVDPARIFCMLNSCMQGCFQKDMENLGTKHTIDRTATLSTDYFF